MTFHSRWPACSTRSTRPAASLIRVRLFAALVLSVTLVRKPLTS
jgi:hypothetical protein